MEKIISNLKNRLTELRFSPQVFVVGMVLSMTFFLLFIDSFKTYNSEISILVNVKSKVALENKKQIIANIIELPKTLSFYDRMLKYNSDVRDVTLGITPNKRKALWNEMISVEKSSENSSVIKVSITADREADSKLLAEKSVRTLFDSVAFYYDIKNDIDLRIIDGPISKTQFFGWYWFLLVSFFLGFIIAKLINNLVWSDKLFINKQFFKDRGGLLKRSFFPEHKSESEMPAEQELELLNNLYQNEEVADSLNFNSELEDKKDVVPSRDENFQEVKAITKKFEPGKYPNFPEMPIAEKRQASAPDNLPIADADFFATYDAPQAPAKEDVEIATEEKVEEKKYEEPTPEELRERLNKLLRGEF